jgi:hypothetical protein
VASWRIETTTENNGRVELTAGISDLRMCDIRHDWRNSNFVTLRRMDNIIRNTDL